MNNVIYIDFKKQVRITAEEWNERELKAKSYIEYIKQLYAKFWNRKHKPKTIEVSATLYKTDDWGDCTIEQANKKDKI